MLLTSSERGRPAASSQPGFSVLGRLRRSRRGEGREPRDGHLVNFFSFFFPLNKCHFLRQRRNREQFRYPFLWGRLMPQAPSLLPKTLIHFPNLVNLQTRDSLLQPNSSENDSSRGLCHSTSFTGPNLEGEPLS